MRPNNNPIGIFDSGVGGLSILQAINSLMPQEDLIYVADSQFTPYGDKSEREIEDRVLAIASFLTEKNVKCIVVACNTATAAAVNQLRRLYSVPIIGLEPALKPAAENSLSGKVGVLATQATLDSQKYENLKQQFGGKLQLIEKASSLFVELVEHSPTIAEKEFNLIRNELEPFRQASVDALVLGCTHYPFLTEAISNIMGNNVVLYESSMPVAKEVKRRLNNQLSTSQSLGSIDFFSSEPEDAEPKLSRLLDRKVIVSLF
jgi:glutamate racemase